MKKNKGFTLIELLAVIVILAIIALIAVPIVLNLINDAKLGAAKSSAIGYMESVKQSIMLGKIHPNDGINIPDSNEITSGDDSDIELDKIDVSGTNPDYVTISFKDGNIKSAGFCIDGFNIDYKDGKASKSNTNYCKFSTVKKLQVKNKINNLVVGESFEIEIESDPKDISPVVTSSNDIVKIDGIKITALKEGNTKITVKAGQKKDNFELSVVKPTGLISYVGVSNFENNTYQTIEINEIKYNTHVYSFNENQIWSENKVFGDSNDVATESEYAKNMVIVKVNGDLTIDENVTVKPYSNEYGGPKGFILYVTGKLTNNGTIDNSHGAKAIGENVYLLKNADESYEYIPDVGSEGGKGVLNKATHAGEAGKNGVNRGTAGGGAGAFYGGNNTKQGNGSGSSGTSYSGGSGGGAGGRAIGEDAYPNGGKGGDAKGSASNQYDGGGAGNPGGKPTEVKATAGQNGTGGLLIVFAKDFINNSKITAEGSLGGTGEDAAGGSSGGGSINIFYKDSYKNSGSISAKGGSSASKNGGKGGDGTISIGTIKNNTYTPIN